MEQKEYFLQETLNKSQTINAFFKITNDGVKYDS